MLFPLDFQIGWPLRDVLLGNYWHSVKLVTVLCSRVQSKKLGV